jgi:hypothetical protein
MKYYVAQIARYFIKENEKFCTEMAIYYWERQGQVATLPLILIFSATKTLASTS